MFGLGFGELILIFLIALIFIGPKKLPELAKGLGKGIREFQDAAKSLTEQVEKSVNEEEKKSEINPQTIAEHPINTIQVTEQIPLKADSDEEKKV